MEGTSTTPPGIVRPWESPEKTLTNSPNGHKSAKYSPETRQTRHSRTKSRSPKSRSLNTKAVELMEMWYQQHAEHPYPSDEVVEFIVKEGNITTTQIRKMDGQQT